MVDEDRGELIDRLRGLFFKRAIGLFFISDAPAEGREVLRIAKGWAELEMSFCF